MLWAEKTRPSMLVSRNAAGSDCVADAPLAGWSWFAKTPQPTSTLARAIHSSAARGRRLTAAGNPWPPGDNTARPDRDIGWGIVSAAPAGSGHAAWAASCPTFRRGPPAGRG